MYKPRHLVIEEIEQFRRELAAIHRDFQALKRDLLADKDWREQPRVPAGNPDGGQWTTDDPDTTGSIGRLLPAARRLLRPNTDATQRALSAALTQYAIGSSQTGRAGRPSPSSGPAPSFGARQRRGSTSAP
jgi:hypothetical protein